MPATRHIINKERLALMTNDEKIDMFAPNAAKLLAKKSEYEVPENGQFSKTCISSSFNWS